MQTPDGHEYHDCQLKRVEADGVVISHRLGVAKLMFYAMPEDFKKTYGYDPDAARQAAAEQEAKNAASDAMVAHQAALDQKADQIANLPPATAPPTSSPAPPVAPRLSDAERAQIQARIATLQQDVAFMKREEAKVVQTADYSTLTTDRRQVTHGGYDDKIAEEQAEIQRLQTELR
jgi:hypothetical protein